MVHLCLLSELEEVKHEAGQEVFGQITKKLREGWLDVCYLAEFGQVLWNSVWRRSEAKSMSTPFRSSLMALGDGRHKLPVKSDVRRAIGKDVGDTVTISLKERIWLLKSASL
jgi:hypothetical protein